MEHRVCKTDPAARRVSMLHRELLLTLAATFTSLTPVTPQCERLIPQEPSAPSLVMARSDLTILPERVLTGWLASPLRDRISMFTWRTPATIAFDVLMFPAR